MREILTEWRTDAGSDGRTVMYFDDTVAVATQRAALGAFWAAIDNLCAGTTQWTVATSGRDVNATDGSLAGAWSDSTPFTGAGGGAGDQSGDALQALVRWQTGQIRNGRFVQGRTFIPGLASTVIVDGNLSAAGITLGNAAASTLAASAAGMVIFHRPSGSNPGTEDPVTSGSMWNELAVLRRRRG